MDAKGISQGITCPDVYGSYDIWVADRSRN